MEDKNIPSRPKTPLHTPKTLTPEELAQREKLVAFLQNFVKAMVQTGYYSQDHPQAKKSKEGLYDSFRQLIGDNHELSFLVRIEKGVGKDIYIDGVSEEPASLNSIMTSTQSDIFLPKFSEYFQRRGLLSFTLKNAVEPDEFSRFVDVMSESRQKSDTDQRKGAQLTQELVDNNIVNVSAVFDNDMVKMGRKVPWRVEIALLRLRKDIGVIPMFRHITPEQMARMKRKVIEDIIRPITHPDLFVEILLNAMNMMEGVDGMQEVDIETEIIKCIKPNYLSDITEKLAGNLSGGSDAAQVSETAMRLLQKLGAIMIVTPNDEFMNAFRRLHDLGILDFNQLPENLRQIIRVEQMAEQFIQYPDAYLNALKNANNPDEYKGTLGVFDGIFSQLIKRGEFEKITVFLKIISSHCSEENAGFEQKQEIARGALAAMGSQTNLHRLMSILEKAEKEERDKVLEVIKLFGSQAVEGLLELLLSAKDVAVRVNICKHLASLGGAAEPFIISALDKPDQPWFFIRNLLWILGEMKSAEARNRIFKHLNHSHNKVREEALVALQKVAGHGAEGAIIAALNDKDVRVVARAVALLNSMRNRNPKALEFYRHVLNPENNYSDSVRAQTCKAIGNLGDFSFADKAGSVDVLAEVIEGGKVKKLFGIVKETTPQYSKTVRKEAVLALGAVGTPKALSILKNQLKDKDEDIRAVVEQVLKRATAK